MTNLNSKLQCYRLQSTTRLSTGKVNIWNRDRAQNSSRVLKIFKWTLTSAFCASLAACGSHSTSEKSEGTPSTSTEATPSPTARLNQNSANPTRSPLDQRLHIPGSKSLKWNPASGGQTKQINLGSASAFNLFLFGDLNQPSSDTEGAIAVGGNARLANYSVGELLEADPTRIDLLVAGDLDFKSGAVNKGAALVGGKVQIGATSFLGGVHQSPSPIDFKQSKVMLTKESHRLASLTKTADIQFQDWGQPRGELSLIGSDPAQNVFNVPTTTLSRTHTFKIQAPPTSMVIVNVIGEIAKFSSMGMSLVGVPRSHVLINFPNARSLTIASISVEGSVLAPMANVFFETGVLRGQLIAHSLTGSGQINHNPIDPPTLPPSAPVPPTPPTNPPPVPPTPQVPYR